MHDLLFDSNLIPAKYDELLGPDLKLRPLALDDHKRGHLELLSVLTIAPRLAPDRYEQTFRYLRSCPNTYFTIVIVHNLTDQLVGCGTVMIERKFTRSAGLTGHIEDIVVSHSMQGRKLGLRIINALEDIGREQGCYKIMLDCSQANIPFYEKCGFKQKEFQMVRYMSDPSTATSSRL